MKAKLPDKTIFKALTDFKGLTEFELEELLGYKKAGLYNRLHTMLKHKKIYCKKIPILKTSTKLRILQKYQGLKVYSLTEEMFKEWLKEQLPKKITPLYKRLFTVMVHDLGLDLDMPYEAIKRQLWIYDNDIYNYLEKTADEKGTSPSKVAEETIRKAMKRGSANS